MIITKKSQDTTVKTIFSCTGQVWDVGLLGFL